MGIPRLGANSGNTGLAAYGKAALGRRRAQGFSAGPQAFQSQPLFPGGQDDDEQSPLMRIRSQMMRQPYGPKWELAKQAAARWSQAAQANKQRAGTDFSMWPGEHSDTGMTDANGQPVRFQGIPNPMIRSRAAANNVLLGGQAPQSNQMPMTQQQQNLVKFRGMTSTGGGFGLPEPGSFGPQGMVRPYPVGGYDAAGRERISIGGPTRSSYRTL